MASIIDSYEPAGANLATFGTPTSNYWIAQTFEASSSYVISKVELELKRVGDLSGLTIQVSVKAVVAGKPSGADLISNTIDPSSIDDSDFEWTSISFASGTKVLSGTSYAIVMRFTGGSSTIKYLGTRDDGGYANGALISSVDGGSSWNILSGDIPFRVYDGGAYTAATPTDKTYSKKLVAFGEDSVYYEDSSGSMTALSGATVVNSSPLTATEAYQKVFVANTSTLKVVDFGNTKITTADVAPAGKTVPSRGDVLVGQTSAAQMIVDFVDVTDGAANVYGYRTTTATFANTETVQVGDGSTSSFVLNAAEIAPPHYYTWTPYGNDTTNYGSMPASAYISCLYRGRLVLSGNSNYPHQWYMSKIGDPWNWAYATNDPLTAVAGNNTDAGEIGDIVRALH
jgi:hypothetical protein